MPRLGILQKGLPSQDDSSARLLTADAGGLFFSSVYAPYGNPRKVVRKGANPIQGLLGNRLREYVEKQHDGSTRSVLCGDFDVVLDCLPQPGLPNYTEEERRQFRLLLGLGFVDLSRCLHPDGKDEFDFGFDPHNSVTARLQLFLGTEDVSNHLQRAGVDLEYRKEIEELKGNKSSRGAPAIVGLHEMGT